MKVEKILSGVPVGDVVYTAGMESELSEKLNPAQFDYLVEQGAIVAAVKNEENNQKTEKENDKKEVRKK